MEEVDLVEMRDSRKWRWNKFILKNMAQKSKVRVTQEAARKATKVLMKYLETLPAEEQEEKLLAFHDAVNEVSSASRAKRKSRPQTVDLRVLYRKRR